ncbi:serine/arginine repetitive matrix protein 3-like [Saccopteryx bilineata]|uniref:serine/arginine repetitive matrix protein 3-like n=1 Tax=Saccopteryx bilineata TaxID=59482 RepID=UPI00338DC027
MGPGDRRSGLTKTIASRMVGKQANRSFVRLEGAEREEGRALWRPRGRSGARGSERGAMMPGPSPFCPRAVVRRPGEGPSPSLPRRRGPHAAPPPVPPRHGTERNLRAAARGEGKRGGPREQREQREPGPSTSTHRPAGRPLPTPSQRSHRAAPAPPVAPPPAPPRCGADPAEPGAESKL